MWILKFKVFDEENPVSKIIRKTAIRIYYYPINYYFEKGRVFFTSTGTVEGEGKNKAQFLRELRKLDKAKKGRRVDVLDIKGDFFFLITSEKLSENLKKLVHLYYDPKLIHHRPIVFEKDGWEDWEISCTDRKILEKIIKVSREKYKGKLLSLQKSQIKNFGILSVLPDLTDKQKKAFLLAVKERYYDVPRKTELTKLAKLMGVSFSTYQVHLRKAEHKILPFISKRI